MDIFTGVKSALTNQAAIMAIVATNTNAANTARIWSEWPRTYVVPAIIIECDQEEMQNDITGHSDLTIAEITITCRADSHSASHALWVALQPIAGMSSPFHLTIDQVVHAPTAKNDGSSAHWSDHVITCTPIWTEVI